MGKRKRRRKRNRNKIQVDADDDTPPNAAVSPPSSGDSSSDLAASTNRNWPDLPEPLLVSIVDRLFSATDYVAFAGACRPWRSASSSAVPRGAPILLVPGPLSLRGRSLMWVGPPRCRLQTLNLQTLNLAKSRQSPISSQILRRTCIGCSYAQLIFLAGGQSVVLADAFTGREVFSPEFPAGSFHFSFGILTAPLSSSSCLLLVVALNTISDVYSILCWRPGSGLWLELELTRSPEILSLVVFKGQVFGLDSLYRIIVVEFEPLISWRLLEAKLSTGKFLYHCYGKFGQHLFECDGELQLVLFVPTGKFLLLGSPKIEVYRLDMLKSVWVKKESLGNWCLFIDAVGKCPFVCPDPSAWGGRRNCVYLAGPGDNGCSGFLVDGEVIDTKEDSPVNSSYLMLPKWPSPIWVYPSMLPLDFCLDN